MTADPGDTYNSGSLRRVAARGGAVTLVAQVIRVLLALTSTLVLARLIAPSSFGLIAMVVAITGIAEIFRDFGLSMAALQARTLSQGQKSNLFWINAAVGTALTGLVFVASWPIAAFYGEPKLVAIVQAISVVYLIGSLSAQFRVSLNRSFRFVALAICDLVPQLLAFAAAVVLAVAGYGLMALVVQQISAVVITLILVVCLSRWWPSWPKRGEQMRSLLSFGVSFSLTQLLTYTVRNIDSVAIGRVWGPVQLGYYDRAFQLSVAPLYQINAPLSRVAIPVLARITGDRARYLATLREGQLVASYVTSTGLLLAAGMAAPLTLLLLGPNWTSASVIFSVLAIGSVFRSLQQIAYWAFMSQGLAGSLLRMNLVAQPVLVCTILAGLPWGALGVAVGSVIGCVAFWIISLVWVGRASDLSVRHLMLDPLRTILVFAAPAGIAAFLITTLVPLAAPWLVALSIATASVWYLFSWLVIPGVRRDLRVLRGFIRAALSRKAR